MGRSPESRIPLDFNLGDLTRENRDTMQRKLDQKKKDVERAEVIRKRNILLHGLSLQKLDNTAFMNHLISQTKSNKFVWHTMEECDYINYKGRTLDSCMKLFSVNRNGMVLVCLIDFGKRSIMKIFLLNEDTETGTVDYPPPEGVTHNAFNITCDLTLRKELELSIASQYEERLEDMKLSVMKKFVKPTEDDLIDMGLGLGQKKSVPTRRRKTSDESAYPWETSGGDYNDCDDL